MELNELIQQLEAFEISDHVDEKQYDDMLDDCYGTATVAGREYSTSRALKELDPVAYRRGFSGYCTTTIELHNFSPYRALAEELAEAVEQITYEVIPPESAAERGYEEEDETLGLDADDMVEAADNGDVLGCLARRIADVLVEYGATQYAGHGASWCTVDGEIDFRTGESTTRAVHFKGLIPDLISAVNASL